MVEWIKKHIRIPRSNLILLTESVAPFVEVEDVLMPLPARLTTLECLSAGKGDIIPPECIFTKGQIHSDNIVDGI